MCTNKYLNDVHYMYCYNALSVTKLIHVYKKSCSVSDCQKKMKWELGKPPKHDKYGNIKYNLQTFKSIYHQT